MMIACILLLLLGAIASNAAATCWKLESWAQHFLAIWLSWMVLVLMNGYLLSPFHLLSSVPVWIALLLIECGVLILIAHKRYTPRLSVFQKELSEWFGAGESSSLVRWFMRGAILWMLLLFAIQAAQVFLLAPSHFDSFTYILPRTLFFLQNGTLERYFTLDTAQQMHATGLAQLQIFFSLGLSRSESAFAIPSLLAYLAGMIAVAESGRKVSGGSYAAGIFASLIYSTATNCLLMSTTAQSDLPIAASIAAAICFLVASAFSPSFGFLLLHSCQLFYWQPGSG
jgi:hypothetical protein